MNPRIKRIYPRLERDNLDALILSLPANISYLAQYPCRDAYLLVSKKENIYFTDSRYLEEARNNLRGFTLQKIKGSVFKIIAESCEKLRLKRVGFEERSLPFAEYAQIRRELNKTIGLVPTHNIVEEFRQIKDREELRNIREAIRITAEALEFTAKFISPGKKEIEVAGEIERFIRYAGAYGPAFEIIVASGPNSSFPHHLTSARKIRNNEAVLVDIGVDYSGYKSDLTRVFFLGKIDTLNTKVYQIVKEAQARAIAEIKPDTSVGAIDNAARQYIARRGYKEFFGHSLGHGLGLEIHEDPHINSRDKNSVEEGMTFTVEPGIYIPDRFGIRIEDIVLVTSQGCEVLSGAINK